ncbi:MAG: hypothetical protein HEQ32_04910 [Vampirovibrio sp.]
MTAKIYKFPSGKVSTKIQTKQFCGDFSDYAAGDSSNYAIGDSSNYVIIPCAVIAAICILLSISPAHNEVKDGHIQSKTQTQVYSIPKF